MAFASGFEYDVFVSYAQVDDLTDEGRGWVSTLVDKLKNRLAALLGRRDSVSLFIDRQLTRHKDLSPEIITSIENSATLLAVLSPGYLISDWCRQERKAFVKKARERGVKDLPLFIVERDRVELDDRPEEFGDKLGYRFWITDEDDIPRILGDPKPMPDDKEYYKTLDRLARELEKQLRQSGKSPGEEISQQDSEDTSSTVTVYVADVTDDLDTEWNDVKTALEQQQKLRVLPQVAYPRDPEEFEQAVSADLEQADLCVQLLSTVVGRKLGKSGHTTVSYQACRAKELGKKILQWRHPSLKYSDVESKVADERHQELLLSAQACNLSEFIAEILTQAKKKKPASSPPLGPGGAFVFVDVYEDDDPLAEELCDYLAERGYDVVKPIKGTKADEFRKAFEANFLDCDAVAVVYGAAQGGWVQNQLVAARKLTYKRDKPLYAMALYEGPPKPKPSLGLRLHNLQVIRCFDGLDPDEIRPFLETIEQGIRASRDSHPVSASSSTRLECATT